MNNFSSIDYNTFFYDNIDIIERDEQAFDDESGDSGLNKIIGGPGKDNLLGTDGGDLMIGKGGADHFASFGGADRLIGGVASDVLDGGVGADRLIGGAGGDYLMGATGNDTMTGGAGYNQFAYQEGPSHGSDRDVITDFDRGTDHFNLMFMPNRSYHFIGRQEFDGAGEVRIENGKNGDVNVLINTDSDGKAELVIHLQDVAKVTADDFFF